MSILDVLHPGVERDAVEGFDAVTLAAGALEATFVPGLGMAGASLRHAGDELLDRRGGLRAYRDTGAVMGLPLLYPWANRLARDELVLDGRRVRLSGSPLVRRDEHGLPIHGLLGAHPGWSVREASSTGERATLAAELDFAADPALVDAFPFPHLVALEATLSARSLRIATTVQATGAAAVPIAFGFHPYLRIPGIERAAWEVGLPARRRLELDERSLPTGRGEPANATRFALADAGFDDGFDGLDAGAAFSVSAGAREIRVVLERGYRAAQVFSPPGAPFICFEPMVAPANAFCSGDGLARVAPGGTFTAAFRIEVRQVDGSSSSRSASHSAWRARSSW
jgi:aldose 1-epimerase